MGAVHVGGPKFCAAGRGRSWRRHSQHRVGHERDRPGHAITHACLQIAEKLLGLAGQTLSAAHIHGTRLTFTEPRGPMLLTHRGRWLVVITAR